MAKTGREGDDRKGGVAAAVHAFYERYPYPGTVDTLDAKADAARAHQTRLCEHHLLWPARPYREDHAILVAGCGTVQAARHALRWPKARVVGIDVSEASLRTAHTLKERHGLANLELRCLTVEDAGTLGEGFDRIICTGVLHHLPDPDAGLAALRAVLAPGGAMHLMLYAPYGRAGIYLMQAYARLLGLGTGEGEIAGLLETLKQLPRDHPLRPLLRASPDFRYAAGIADALLHPQDRPYSVPQMLALVRANGLAFGRWLRQAPYLPDCGAPAATPHGIRLTALDADAQAEAMELFRGTMLRHSAILYRDDEANVGAIGFENEDWRHYIPLRLPEAICVTERLPPGKAGVLINTRHADADLYLPVTQEEKRMVEAIDGRRSIGALAGPGEREAARTLFRRLWRHDQVVFDASRAKSYAEALTARVREERSSQRLSNEALCPAGPIGPAALRRTTGRACAGGG